MSIHTCVCIQAHIYAQLHTNMRAFFWVLYMQLTVTWLQVLQQSLNEFPEEVGNHQPTLQVLRHAATLEEAVSQARKLAQIQNIPLADCYGSFLPAVRLELCFFFFFFRDPLISHWMELSHPLSPEYSHAVHRCVSPRRSCPLGSTGCLVVASKSALDTWKREIGSVPISLVSSLFS